MKLAPKKFPSAIAVTLLAGSLFGCEEKDPKAVAYDICDEYGERLQSSVDEVRRIRQETNDFMTDRYFWRLYHSMDRIDFRKKGSSCFTSLCALPGVSDVLQDRENGHTWDESIESLRVIGGGVADRIENVRSELIDTLDDIDRDDIRRACFVDLGAY